VIVQMRRDHQTPEERFDLLFRTTSDDVLAYMLRRARTPEDAADALSETYAAAWRKLDKLPDGERARLWLFGAARNELRKSADRARAEDGLFAELAQQLRPSLAENITPSDSGGALVSALGGLSRIDQEIVTLTAWEALTPREIGEVLGLSANVVRVRLHRARGNLRSSLGERRSEARPPSPIPQHIPR
jgi:RNA polymerase sigma-70 factor, ECF subfamily